MIFLLPVLALSSALSAQSADENPILSGYITSFTGPEQIAVDGKDVHLLPTTTVNQRHNHARENLTRPYGFYLGEHLEIYGRWDKSHIVQASQVDIPDLTLGSVSGKGIVDLAPATPNLPANQRTLRADGYVLHISTETKLALTPPLQNAADLGTNQWIEFQGALQPDGSVSVLSARVRRNIVSLSEADMHQDEEFDPSKVKPEDKQSGVNRFFLGPDLKKVPAYTNLNMQARIDRIAQSLVPAYQRNLPASDPTKLNFRFQLVDEPKTNFAWSLSNGINLVPYQLVQRLPDDSQLAAVLAGNIAVILEKEGFRNAPAYKAITATNVAALGASLFVPGLGLVTSMTTGGIAQHMMLMNREQSGRVSLALMHDAGYDLKQAPMAWWLLVPKEAKPVEKIPIPARSLYLYEFLGRTYPHA